MTESTEPDDAVVVRRVIPVPRERVFAAWLDPLSLSSDRPAGHESALAALQSRAVGAQRRELIKLRAGGVIGDDAFHAAEEEIDLLDLTADARIRPDRRE